MDDSPCPVMGTSKVIIPSLNLELIKEYTTQTGFLNNSADYILTIIPTNLFIQQIKDKLITIRDNNIIKPLESLNRSQTGTYPHNNHYLPVIQSEYTFIPLRFLIECLANLSLNNYIICGEGIIPNDSRFVQFLPSSSSNISIERNSENYIIKVPNYIGLPRFYCNLRTIGLVINGDNFISNNSYDYFGLIDTMDTNCFSNNPISATGGNFLTRDITLNYNLRNILSNELLIYGGIYGFDELFYLRFPLTYKINFPLNILNFDYDYPCNLTYIFNNNSRITLTQINFENITRIGKWQVYGEIETIKNNNSLLSELPTFDQIVTHFNRDGNCSLVNGGKFMVGLAHYQEMNGRAITAKHIHSNINNYSDYKLHISEPLRKSLMNRFELLLNDIIPLLTTENVLLTSFVSRFTSPLGTIINIKYGPDFTFKSQTGIIDIFIPRLSFSDRSYSICRLLLLRLSELLPLKYFYIINGRHSELEYIQYLIRNKYKIKYPATSQVTLSGACGAAIVYHNNSLSCYPRLFDIILGYGDIYGTDEIIMINERLNVYYHDSQGSNWTGQFIDYDCNFNLYNAVNCDYYGHITHLDITTQLNFIYYINNSINTNFDNFILNISTLNPDSYHPFHGRGCHTTDFTHYPKDRKSVV